MSCTKLDIDKRGYGKSEDIDKPWMSSLWLELGLESGLGMHSLY